MVYTRYYTLLLLPYQHGELRMTAITITYYSYHVFNDFTIFYICIIVLMDVNMN